MQLHFRALLLESDSIDPAMDALTVRARMKVTVHSPDDIDHHVSGIDNRNTQSPNLTIGNL
jgi:hypothetical protein